MVKDHSDSEGGNDLPPLDGLLFSRDLLYAKFPTDRISHTTTSCGALAAMGNS